MTPGTVILLNGVSSSGKTTLARALQDRLAEPYLLCSLDAFWDMTPRAIPASSRTFPFMKLAMAQSVRSLADTGHNVIADIVHNGETSHRHFVEALDGVPFFTIKVSCDENELHRREVVRGDRTPGLALSQLETVHQGIEYDLEIDTSRTSLDEAVSIIVERSPDPFSISCAEPDAQNLV